MKGLAKNLNLEVKPRIREVDDEFAENGEKIQMVDNYRSIESELDDYQTYGYVVWKDRKFYKSYIFFL